MDKLVEKYTENIDEAKIAGITWTELHSAEDKNVCKCSCAIFLS